MAQRWHPSVTVAAVIEDRGRFLLVEERTPEGLMFNNPAGHLDPGESLADGAAREALEETARRFTPTALVGIYLSRFQRRSVAADPARAAVPATLVDGVMRPALSDEIVQDVTYLRFAFCGTAGEPEPGRALDRGIVRTVWMTLEELHATRTRHRSPLVVRCAEEYLAGCRYPLDALSTHTSVLDPDLKW